VIERNDDYWGEKPPLKKITFQTIADEDARLNGVFSGSVDIALISPNQTAAIENESSVKVVSRASNGVTFLAGEPVVLEYATDGRIPLSVEVAQAIQGFLENVGITVRMSGMDQASEPVRAHLRGT